MPTLSKSMAFRMMFSLVIVVSCAGTAVASTTTDALVTAILKGDQAAAEVAVAGGADINGLNSSGDFPINALTAAVLTESTGLQAWLISKGANPAAHDYEALVIALEFRELNAALLFLHTLHSLPPNSSLLVVLTARMSSEVAQKARGGLVANMLGHPPDEQTAASLLDSLERPDFCGGADDPVISVADLIIKLGVSVDASTDLSDPPNASPLLLAIKNGDVFLAHFLISKGAKVPANRAVDADLLISAASVGNSAGVQALLENHLNPDTSDFQGRRALPESLLHGHDVIVKQLMDAGAGPNLSGTGQNSPLVIAANRNSLDESLQLISKGADINLHDSLGDWPLRSAARSGSIDVLEKLIALHANVNATDPEGNTALHNFIAVESPPYSKPHLVPVSQQQLEVVPKLQTAGLQFNMRNHNGDSILISNLILGYGVNIPDGPIQYSFLEELVNAGAPIDSAALFYGIQERDDVLVAWLLSHGANPNASQDAVTALQKACSADQTNYKITIAILKAGATLPASDRDRFQLIANAIQNNAPDVVALLLNKSAGLTSRLPELATATLDSALRSGNTAIVQLLALSGMNINAQDLQGNTSLHRLIQLDLQPTSPDHSVITPAVEKAIAVLVESGADLSLKNKKGLTVRQLASQNSGATDDLLAALGLADTPANALHRAVRDNDTNKVIALIAGGVDINAQDSLQRTPLTRALELHHVSVARVLLRHNAAITYLPATESQASDISYATDPDLAPSFAVRLLSQQLLLLQPGDLTNPANAITQFNTNQSAVIPSIDWSFTCDPCNGTARLGDNESDKSLRVRSSRVKRFAADYFQLIQYNISPVPVVMPSCIMNCGPGPDNGRETSRDFVYTPRGALIIPPCPFDFLKQANCYPGVLISDDPSDSLFIKARDGSAIPLPSTPLQVTQNGISTQVQPGTTVTFDRALGELTVQVGPISSKVFSLGFTAELQDGPSTSVPLDFSLSARMSTYSQIAALRAQFDAISNSHDHALPVKAKVLTTAVHQLSVNALNIGYLAALRQSFASRAQDVLDLNDQMLSLRNLIIANSSMTADQIDVLITRIDTLLPGLSANQSSAAILIRNQLQLAKASIAGTNSAARILQDQFTTYIDRVIVEYQELALELAQFIEVAKLSSSIPLSAADVAAIKSKLNGTDVGVQTQHSMAKAPSCGRPSDCRRPSRERLLCAKYL